MSDEKPSAKEEFRMLGRGVLRTFFRDVMAMAVGGVVGALVGWIAAFMLWLPPRFGLYLGAVLGVMLALMGRSLFSRLFEYDRPPKS